MKYELGRCLLSERLLEANINVLELAQTLRYRPERLYDFIENKRVMPLQVALSVADTIGCNTRNLYELVPFE